MLQMEHKLFGHAAQAKAEVAAHLQKKGTNKGTNRFETWNN
jgi:hypothetical protein